MLNTDDKNNYSYYSACWVNNTTVLRNRLVNKLTLLKWHSEWIWCYDIGEDIINLKHAVLLFAVEILILLSMTDNMLGVCIWQTEWL